MASKKKSTKSKKKTKVDPAQKSLMGFLTGVAEKKAEKASKKPVEKPVTKKKELTPKSMPEIKKEVKKEEPKKTEKVAPNSEEKAVEVKKKKQKAPTGKKLIKSDLKFYKKDTTPFGEQIFTKKTKHQKGAAKALYMDILKENDLICKNMEEGLLLTVEYSGIHNCAYAKFYDLKDQKIKFWMDTTGHQPYALHRRSKEEIEKVNTSYIDKDGTTKWLKLVDWHQFDRMESTEIEDLIYDKMIKATKIYAKTPNDIGRKGEISQDWDPSVEEDRVKIDNIKLSSVYNFLAKYKIEGHWDEDNAAGAWEANIRYHHNYIYDRKLVPGLIYNIENSVVTPVELEGTEDLENQMLELFSDEPDVFQEMAQRYMKIFSYPIPDMRRVAFDIEVDVPEEKNLPDPVRAAQKVTSISFCGSDGLNKVYVLWRDDVELGEDKHSLPEKIEVIFFQKERDLIIETFRMLWDYPVIISFNGDNFDLNYLFHRAKILKIPNEINPIEIKRSGGQSMSRTNAFLKYGVHLDIFQVFANRSLKGYAFGNAYEKSSLDQISKAFLHSEKIKHETGDKFSADDIATMDLHTLVYYNMIDSVLTLELTQFGNNSVMNLIVYLMRITKLPLQDLIRHQISFWIRNILYYEHRFKNYLIPRQKELETLKPARLDRNIGGHVFEPTPGIHFDVMVMDFSSLYPSIIKRKNLSYETVMCNHPVCKDNFLPNSSYHVCKKRMGIFALVVGFFRDIRVKWFKPKSSDPNLPELERDSSKTLSAAIKVFVNASYGTFGSDAFVLKCSPVAEATTSIGRYSIQQTMEKAKSLNVPVLYGDTDSVFLLNPTKEQADKISKWSSEVLDLDLEAEKTYRFLALSNRKKNYVGIYTDGHIDIKGMSAKKSNTPAFISRAFKEVVEILKKITNMEEFEREKENIIKITRSTAKRIGKPLEKRGFPIEDYSVTVRLSKAPDKYTKTTPQFIKATRKVEEELRRRGQKMKFLEGDYVTYVKTTHSDGVYPIYQTLKPKISDINKKKYEENLQKVFEQLLDALGISWEEDIKGRMRLDAFGI